MRRSFFTWRLGRSIDLIVLLLVLFLPRAAAALPLDCLLVGTVLQSNNLPCAGCQVTVRTPFDQEVAGGTYPQEPQGTVYITDPMGEMPVGATSTQGLWVEITVAYGHPNLVQIPMASEVDISTLILEPSTPPTSSNINTFPGVRSLSGGGTGSAGPWTPLRCVHINALGNAMEVTGADCGTGTGGGGGNALLDGTVHTDTLAGTVARGDLIVGNSTPKWSRLPISTAGKVLATDGIDAFWQTKPVFDVRDYGVKCDGTTDDTAAIASAMASMTDGGILQFPLTSGGCIFTSIDASASTGHGINLRGTCKADNNDCTNLRCNNPSGTCITMGTDGVLENFNLKTKSGVTNTTSNVYIQVPAASSRTSIRNLLAVTSCGTCLRLDGGSRVNYVQNLAPVAGGIGVHLRDAISASFDFVTVDTTAAGSVGWKIEQVTAQPDSNVFFNSGAAGNGIGLWITGADATKMPRWQHFVNFGLESTASSTVLIEKCRDCVFTDSYFLGGTNTVNITGGKGIQFNGGIMFGAQQDVLSHSGDSDTELNDVIVADGGQSLTNCAGTKYSGVALSSTSQHFRMNGGQIGDGFYYAAGKSCYGTTCTAGANKYAFRDVRCDSNTTACNNGCTAPANQVAFSDAHQAPYIDARDYGVVCDSPANTTCGTTGTDNTAALAAAVSAATALRGATILLPAGTCRFSTLNLNGIDGTVIQGQGAADSFTGTTLCTSTLNAPVITVTRPRQFIQDVSITTGGVPVLGQILVYVNGDNGAGGGNFSNLFLTRVFMDNFYEGVRAYKPSFGSGGSINMDWVTMAAQVDAVHAIYLGSVEDRIANTTVLSTVNESAALVDIDAGLGRIDTIKIENSTFNMPSGKTGPTLWIHRSATTQPLQWIQLTGLTLESDYLSPDPTIKIDGGANVLKDLVIADSYILGGQNTIQINGGNGIKITNSNVFGAGQECLLHNADAPTYVSNTEFVDCGRKTANTYSDVKLGASSRNFNMIGGRTSAANYVTTTPKYGIEIATGADKYRFDNVDCQGNGTACASALVPSATQTALTGSVALGDADWSNYGVLRATDPLTANRTWTFPDESGTVAMTAVYDVRDYGARCNDSTDDTAAIQAAINAAAATGIGGVVQFPAGICITTALTANEPGIILRGQGGATSNNGTTLSCNMASGTCVTFGASCTYCGIERMSPKARPAATTLMLIDGSAASSTFARDLVFSASGYCTAIKNVSNISNVDLFGPVAGPACRGISIVDHGAHLDHVTGNWSTAIDGMIVLEQTAAGQVDTVQISDAEIAQSLGSGAALKVIGTSSTNPPRWIHIENSFFEGKTTGAAAGDYPIYIGNTRDFECSNCYAQGGYHGVHIAGGPGPITFSGGIIASTMREAFYHDADVITSLVGTTVSDGGNETTNTYSDVYLSTNSRNFSMTGGAVGSELGGFIGNKPKYGIEVASGADKYRVSNVNCTDVPVSGCASGLVPATTQGWFSDAVALGNTTWSNYGVLKAPTLTANRAWTFPDADGTVVLRDGAGTVTATTFVGNNTSATGQNLQLFSDKSVAVRVDTDNNDTVAAFVVQGPTAATLLEVNENNNIYFRGNISTRWSEANNANAIIVRGPSVLTVPRTILWPDESGTVCTTGSVCAGYQSSFTNQGTVNQLLHGNAAGAPTWGAVDLTTSQVTGVLPNANTTGTSANTANAIVARNATGGFSAGNLAVDNVNAGFTINATTFAGPALTTAQLVSDKNVSLKVDADNNDTATGLNLITGAGATLFAVNQNGNAQLADNLRIGDLTTPTGTLDVLGKLVVNSSGVISRYNNVGTVGFGMAPIYADNAISATKTATFTITTFTPSSFVGRYLVYAVLTTTSAAQGGTLQCTIDHTNSQGTASVDIMPIKDSTGTIGATIPTVASSKEYPCLPTEITVNNAGAAIVVKAVATGTVAYTASATIQQLGVN